MKIFAVRDGGDLVRVDAEARVGNGQVGAVDALLALCVKFQRQGEEVSYREIVLGSLLPVINFSQASAHSRMMSVAYLYYKSAVYTEPMIRIAHFLFLHSPENANWFSGLPSGIL